MLTGQDGAADIGLSPSIPVESPTMAGAEYLWSFPAATRLSATASSSIIDWCRAWSVKRPMLIGGGFLTATPRALALGHAMEAAQLAVWSFDRATSPALAIVADAVASYHFENCDAVIAIGGAVAMDVAKATALMAGQRNSFSSLACEPGVPGAAIDASAVPPFLALPATPAAALAVGGVVWIADELGVARPVRHPVLRPDEAILADDLIRAVPAGTQARSSALAVLTAADAGCADVDLIGLLRADVSARGSMRRALELASTVEGARGLRRRLALSAALIDGADFGRTMLALLGAAEWRSDVCARLGGQLDDSLNLGADLVRSVREACGAADRAELDRLLLTFGIDVPDSLRRRGRRGRGVS